MKRIDWNALGADERTAVLRRPVQAVSDTLREGVRTIFDAVAARGDGALRDYTAQFDGVSLEDFEVGAGEFEAAAGQVPANVQAAILEAAARIEAFHGAGLTQPYEVETAPGLLCQRVQRPINRVGLYVPAGSAPLPSTALMLCIPARLAGCGEIILCTPPRADGSADFYGSNGALFFIGIMLTLVFMLAAVLILYYKQISEGYEDQKRFEIMQKVGMTKKEIRRSINSQLLTVFFVSSRQCCG